MASVDSSPKSQSPRDLARQRVGTVFAARWELEALIGLGGMAAVYRSTDADHGPIALKILHSEFAENRSVRERFLREAQLTRAVDHPGRVEIYDDGLTEDGEAYFAMELLEGVALDRLWKKRGRKLPPEYALKVADRVLELLAVCHEQSIVHRDLKPANIFITKTGQVKVLDFGVARKREEGVDATMVGTALGTPAYMAPEQAMGAREAIDGRADIFSIGAVLHALITGKKLHQGRSEQEAFVLAATRPAPSVARTEPNLVPELVALIDRALQWDRRNRFPDAEAMRAELATVLVALKAPDSAGSQEVGSSRRLLAAASQAVAGSLDSAEPDQATELVAELFRNFERALGAVRQYGPQHPMPKQRVEQVHGELNGLFTALETELRWEVLPHSFARGTTTIWEPIHPFDQIPYNLFASGFRSMALQPGITVDELSDLLDLLRKDPLRDFAPEDDLATAFWERRFGHIDYQVVGSLLSMSDGKPIDWGADDEPDEEGEALDGLIDEARVSAVGEGEGVDEPLSLEARAVAIAARASALQAARADGALSLSDAETSKLRQQLELPEAAWAERLDVALTDATLWAMDGDRLDLMAGALRTRLEVADTAADQADALTLVSRLRGALERARGEDAAKMLAASVIDDGALRHLLRTLETTDSDLVPASRGGDRASAPPPNALYGILPDVLEDLDARFFEPILSAFTRARNESTRRALVKYLQRNAEGNEAALGDTLENAEVERARAVMGLLAAVKTPAAAEALARAERNASPQLRVEAVALRAAASPAGLRDELTQLCSDPDAAIRRAALETMARHKVKEAGPPLAQQIQSSAFHKRAVAERELAIRTLHELNPHRAEIVALDLAMKSSMISRGAAVDSRVVAIEALGRFAEQPSTVEALIKISKKWSNPEPVRAAAAVAATQVQTRTAR